MKIFIVGANGQIGTLLTKELKETDQHTPIAMIRKEEQKEKFEELGADTVLSNLKDSVDELAEAMKGCDAVVFTAGSGGSTGSDQTLLIDLDGAVKTMEAAEKAGIRRYVMVSAFQADNRENWNEEIKSYYVAKYYADKELMLSDLDFTIVRPGMLSNEDSVGTIAVGDKALNRKDKSIPRIDVAKVIVASLDNESTINKAFDLVSGDQDIAKALNQLD